VRTITSAGAYGYDRVETNASIPDELAQYEGRYDCPKLDFYWAIVAANDDLIARRCKYADRQHTLLFRDTFSDDWDPLIGYPTSYLVVFERDEQGKITGLRVSGTRERFGFGKWPR
jgi:hypothetical protein